jgi:hypothetical protein
LNLRTVEDQLSGRIFSDHEHARSGVGVSGCGFERGFDIFGEAVIAVDPWEVRVFAEGSGLRRRHARKLAQDSPLGPSLVFGLALAFREGVV